MLTIAHLSKSYGRHRALDDLNVQLPAGQFCALLGPNGAGKSTLFQLLSGLFKPDEGTIHVDGISMQQHPARALARIGVVFQQLALDLDLSTRHNLLFHADLHGLDRRFTLERIENLSERLGLHSDLDRKTRELSGGQRRKVELARALLHQPALLLMDEATVGLDPQSRRDLMLTVREETHARRCCVLWATHWVEEAVQADRVLLLHHGHLIADGTPTQVTETLGHETLEQGFIARTHPSESNGGPLAAPRRQR